MNQYQQGLLEKRQRARQTRVEVGGFVFVCRRPTRQEAEIMKSTEITMWTILKTYIVGWEGVKEIDLFPGGGSVPVEFCPELCADFIADHSEFWEPIGLAVISEYEAFQNRLSETKKN